MSRLAHLARVAHLAHVARGATPAPGSLFAHLEHNRRPSADQIARAAQHIQFICALRYRQGSSSPGQTAPEKHRSALAGVPERAPPPLGGGFNPGHGKRLAASTGTRAVVDVRNERGACHARRAWFTNGARGRLVAHGRSCRTCHTWRAWRAWHICTPGLPDTPCVPGASCQLVAPSAQSRSASEICYKPIVNQQ